MQVKLAVELYAEKPQMVREGTYCKLALRQGGFIDWQGAGEDVYQVGFVLFSGKRLAGSGRKHQYDYNFLPGGLGSGQARPGAWLEVAQEHVSGLAAIVETNLLLEEGLFRHNFGLRLINQEGKAFEIPLARPDVEVVWAGRGRFMIPIGEYILSKIFAA